ncbi:hypothetical protein TorRG33x02_181100 [Trema orientale]|uniref:Uncharacterized protein n=1 Tax=Trema orientale TaxID=63057 RepID=A0A2P5EKK1_TREOI|nr:hypothetical protein TorRG33x02_181100 [Trema orientale]
MYITVPSDPYPQPHPYPNPSLSLSTLSPLRFHRRLLSGVSASVSGYSGLKFRFLPRISVYSSLALPQAYACESD